MDAMILDLEYGSEGCLVILHIWWCRCSLKLQRDCYSSY